MTTPTRSNALLPLIAKLKECSSQDNSFSEEVLCKTWERFRAAWEPGDNLTPAVMAGLILYDGHFAQLLDEAERSQMVALSKLALERYHEKTNPPNKLGKTIAASWKESI